MTWRNSVRLNVFFSRKIKGFRGVPSHDTFNRVFSLLKLDLLERAFRVWIAEICGKYKEVVPIDGKTICGATERKPDGWQFLKIAYCQRMGLCQWNNIISIEIYDKSNKNNSHTRSDNYQNVL